MPKNTMTPAAQIQAYLTKVRQTCDPPYRVEERDTDGKACIFTPTFRCVIAEFLNDGPDSERINSTFTARPRELDAIEELVNRISVLPCDCRYDKYAPKKLLATCPNCQALARVADILTKQ